MPSYQRRTHCPDQSVCPSTPQEVQSSEDYLNQAKLIYNIHELNNYAATYTSIDIDMHVGTVTLVVATLGLAAHLERTRP